MTRQEEDAVYRRLARKHGADLFNIAAMMSADQLNDELPNDLTVQTCTARRIRYLELVTEALEGREI